MSNGEEVHFFSMLRTQVRLIKAEASKLLSVSSDNNLLAFSRHFVSVLSGQFLLLERKAVYQNVYKSLNRLFY